ncbi:MAG: hypothetical protein GQ532_14540 [Methylomarinum sp.]|nr:hypothetical protein [Methylomarinum sp.]
MVDPKAAEKEQQPKEERVEVIINKEGVEVNGEKAKVGAKVKVPKSHVAFMKKREQIK